MTEKKFSTGKLKQMTPEEVAEALRKRAKARAEGSPLPSPPEPGPTYRDVTKLATTSAALWAALWTGRARGYEGLTLCCYIIVQLTETIDRLYSAYTNALDHVPMVYRLEEPDVPCG